MPDTKLQQHGGNEKALVFSTIDFAEEKPKEESLCIRFGTPESTSDYMDALFDVRFCHFFRSGGVSFQV